MESIRRVSVDDLLQPGLEFYERNLMSNAIRCWQDALVLDPGNSRARDYLNTAGVAPPPAPGLQGRRLVRRLGAAHRPAVVIRVDEAVARSLVWVSVLPREGALGGIHLTAGEEAWVTRTVERVLAYADQSTLTPFDFGEIDAAASPPWEVVDEAVRRLREKGVNARRDRWLISVRPPEEQVSRE